MLPSVAADRFAARPPSVTASGAPTPIDFITKDFNARPLIPWHQTSTGRAGVLTTFVAGSGAPVIPGPPVGLDVFSRELFTFDCWGARTMPG